MACADFKSCHVLYDPLHIPKPAWTHPACMLMFTLLMMSCKAIQAALHHATLTGQCMLLNKLSHNKATIHAALC